MSSEILRRENQDAAPTSTAEVEFALVLSRMIDSVKNDPQHLRETVYELARHKLQEQFTHENVKEMRPLSDALEVAIKGVESFARKDDEVVEALRIPALTQGQDAAPVARLLAPPPFLNHAQVYEGVHEQAYEQGYEPTRSSRSQRRIPAFSAPWRFAFLIAIVFVVGVAIRYRNVSLDSLRAEANLITNLIINPIAPTQPAAQPAASGQAALAAPAVAKPSPLVPASYGIYAVSADKLYELELLPGRAPDIRIAISAAIATPSRTILPDGHLKFVVYRRDSASSAADRAEVRVIAKVVRAVSFDETGKAVVAKADESWVIRNISIPYRTAPNKDDPDMYEVQSEDPDQALSPGRYALILRGQSYDFSIAGDVTDPKQCLERLAATNGQFYSECRKP
jgi:hypothetical protein